MGVQNYRELKVWQQAVELTVRCYGITRSFPREEMFGMTSQIRRAAASVPANIAEGQGRGHPKEFLQFVHIARGSLRELETHLIVCGRVGLIDEDSLSHSLQLCEEVGRMITGLRQYLLTQI